MLEEDYLSRFTAQYSKLQDSIRLSNGYKLKIEKLNEHIKHQELTIQKQSEEKDSLNKYIGDL